jgi:hypothetical protein
MAAAVYIFNNLLRWQNASELANALTVQYQLLIGTGPKTGFRSKTWPPIIPGTLKKALQIKSLIRIPLFVAL